ncbi:unnamed protein product [Cyprideis torosa]|uniref:Uncharacterized protein n=1 Tax=Cyprideis torosa TaxID=163714 RepID=A0A7R8WC29_9CRUS|nr:unnamed protein product [Cyprideis torosa]CAG0891558.1 unnamed protein product [Cyprideis torosa]
MGRRGGGDYPRGPPWYHQSWHSNGLPPPGSFRGPRQPGYYPGYPPNFQYGWPPLPPPPPPPPPQRLRYPSAPPAQGYPRAPRGANSFPQRMPSSTDTSNAQRELERKNSLSVTLSTLTSSGINGLKMSPDEIPNHVEDPEALLRAFVLRKTIYCEVCTIFINSEQMRESHVRGMKHMKKLKTFMEQRPFDSNLQPGYDGIVYKDAPNKTNRPWKRVPGVPGKLKAMLEACARDPVVGIEFVTEILNMDNPQLEPRYQCSLCVSEAPYDGMYSHVTRIKHISAFLDYVDVKVEEDVPGVRKKKIEKAWEFQSQFGKQLDKLKVLREVEPESALESESPVVKDSKNRTVDAEAFRKAVASTRLGVLIFEASGHLLSDEEFPHSDTYEKRSREAKKKARDEKSDQLRKEIMEAMHHVVEESSEGREISKTEETSDTEQTLTSAECVEQPIKSPKTCDTTSVLPSTEDGAEKPRLTSEEGHNDSTRAKSPEGASSTTPISSPDEKLSASPAIVSERKRKGTQEVESVDSDSHDPPPSKSIKLEDIEEDASTDKEMRSLDSDKRGPRSRSAPLSDHRNAVNSPSFSKTGPHRTHSSASRASPSVMVKSERQTPTPSPPNIGIPSSETDGDVTTCEVTYGREKRIREPSSPPDSPPPENEEDVEAPLEAKSEATTPSTEKGYREESGNGSRGHTSPTSEGGTLMERLKTACVRNDNDKSVAEGLILHVIKELYKYTSTHNLLCDDETLSTIRHYAEALQSLNSRLLYQRELATNTYASASTIPTECTTTTTVVEPIVSASSTAHGLLPLPGAPIIRVQAPAEISYPAAAFATLPAAPSSRDIRGAYTIGPVHSHSLVAVPTPTFSNNWEEYYRRSSASTAMSAVPRTTATVTRDVEWEPISPIASSPGITGTTLSQSEMGTSQNAPTTVVYENAVYENRNLYPFTSVTESGPLLQLPVFYPTRSNSRSGGFHSTAPPRVPSSVGTVENVDPGRGSASTTPSQTSDSALGMISSEEDEINLLHQVASRKGKRKLAAAAAAAAASGN